MAKDETLVVRVDPGHRERFGRIAKALAERSGLEAKPADALREALKRGAESLEQELGLNGGKR